ncbi:MAG: hypothetical protein RDU25_05885 [Patescibacteria group bacterium]|nr:hypothetical protein [Patescibacteria group bacterium]
MPNAPSDRPTPYISPLTPEEYAKLGESERERVHRLAFRLNKPLADQAFADPDVAWILVADSPGKIVAQGKRNERMSDTRISEIEQQTSKVCYFYSRPDELVEEIPREKPRFPWASPRHKPGSIGPFVDSKQVVRQRGEMPFRYDFPGDEISWPPPYRLHRLDRNR